MHQSTENHLLLIKQKKFWLTTLNEHYIHRMCKAPKAQKWERYHYSNLKQESQYLQ